MKRSLRSWLWRVPIDQEVEEELAFHIEMRTRELIESGTDPVAARQMVLARIGDLGRLKRTCLDLGRKRDREMHLTQWLEEALSDVRFAIRQLRRAPGFTLVAAITLALGIGANSAMFALADATLLRPLPFSESERLVLVEEHGPEESGRSRVELLNLRDWTEQSRTFEAMAGVWIPAAGGGPTMIGSDGTPEKVPGQNVTASFFDVFGVTPIAGRTFLPADETSDARVVVLSEGFWRRRFAADPAIVGRDIILDSLPFTVIGIVPAQLQFTPELRFLANGIGATSVWTLLPLPRDSTAGNARGQCGSCRFLQAVGRLKPGVSIEAARSDLTVLADSLARRNGGRLPRRVTVTSLRDALIGRELRLTSVLFLAVVGLVLLLCCANVASLVLARASSRTRELAVRSALGAGRRRIVAQLLTESLVLATLGGLLGFGVGAAILRVAPVIVPAGLIPGAVTLGFDARIASFCAAITLVVGVLFGLMPALHITGTSLAHGITSESRTATGRGGSFRTLIVIGEIAVAVVVLCGAGLLLRTLLVLDSFDPGYRAERGRLVTADFTMPALAPDSRYPTRESLLQFYDAVQREVAAIPVVRSVGWATTLPLGGSQIGQQGFDIVGDLPLGVGNQPQANLQIVSATYFQTMDLPIVTGRVFTDRDTSESVPVCIVNEAFVRRYLQGRNPLGARISVGLTGGRVVREIVGVARQVKGRPDEVEELLQLYLPLQQSPWPETYLIVRAVDGAGLALAPAIRQAVANVDRVLAVRNIMTLEDVADAATSRYRFRAVLVTTFAGLALVLAMVGVFGVLAYSVQQRWREFGVRIALGATAGNVIRLVLGGAARVIVAGAAIGLLAAAAMARSISTFLFGVQPVDPVTFASVALVLVATAFFATAAPAFRASRVDPVEVFRGE